MSFKDHRSAEKINKSSLADLQEMFASGCLATFSEIYTAIYQQGEENGDETKKINKAFGKHIKKLWSGDLSAYMKFFDEKKITPLVEQFVTSNVYLILYEKLGKNVPRFSFELPEHADIVSKIIEKATKIVDKNTSAFDVNEDDHDEKMDELQEKISEIIESVLSNLVSKKDVTVAVPKKTSKKYIDDRYEEDEYSQEYYEEEEEEVVPKKKETTKKTVTAAATTTAVTTEQDEISSLMEKIQNMAKDNPKRSAYKKKLKALLMAADESL